MRITMQLAVIALSGLLVSCTTNPHPMDMTRAVQDAKTRSDHEALARHYEDEAKEMTVQLEKHKRLLAQYEAVRGFEARQYHDLIDHCRRLIRIYEEATVENRSMAKSHDEIAAELK